MNPSPPVRTVAYAALVSATLVALRRARKLTQRALAWQLQEHQSAWSRIEAATQGLSIVQLARVAAVLDTTAAEVLAIADEAIAVARQHDVVTTYDAADIPEGSAAVDPAPYVTVVLLAREREAMAHRTGLAHQIASLALRDGAALLGHVAVAETEVDVAVYAHADGAALVVTGPGVDAPLLAHGHHQAAVAAREALGRLAHEVRSPDDRAPKASSRRRRRRT